MDGKVGISVAKMWMDWKVGISAKNSSDGRQ